MNRFGRGPGSFRERTPLLSMPIRLMHVMLAREIKCRHLNYLTFPIGKDCPLMEIVGYWAFLNIFSARAGLPVASTFQNR